MLLDGGGQNVTHSLSAIQASCVATYPALPRAFRGWWCCLQGIAAFDIAAFDIATFDIAAFDIATFDIAAFNTTLLLERSGWQWAHQVPGTVPTEFTDIL